jgi:transposase-like protein
LDKKCIFVKKGTMIHYQEIKCPKCKGNKTCKNGKSRNGTQRWKCLNESCTTATFQLNYRYNGNKEGIKEKIEDQTLNSSGVRDIARNLKISKTTVISHLKKKK